MKKCIENFMTVKNPWSDGCIEGYLSDRKWNGFSFIIRPCSVVAVKGGQAITECVTINGAIRHLKYYLSSN